MSGDLLNVLQALTDMMIWLAVFLRIKNIVFYISWKKSTIEPRLKGGEGESHAQLWRK